MSETFDKLKALLTEKGTLSDDEIKKMIEAHGELSAEEHAKLSAEIHEKQRASQKTVSFDEYMAAMKVLDSAAEGSDEYKKAEEIVERFENAS